MKLLAPMSHSKVPSRRLSRGLTSVVLSAAMIGGVTSGVLLASAIPAGATTSLTKVQVTGAQNVPVTYAGGTVTFPVTVTESHSGTSYHDMNLTAVSDSSAAVTFGGSSACQTANSSNTTYNYTLTVVVPAGDTPGTFANSLVVTATDWNSTDGTCSADGGSNSTLASNQSGGTNGALTIGKAAQAPLAVTSTAGTFGTPLTLTTSGGSGTGAVTFAVVNGTGSGCAISGSGPYTLNSTVAGTCLVTATKATDTNYLAISSAQTSVALTVPVATTTAVASTTGPSVVGQSVTYTGTVSSGSGTPNSGTIEFFDSGNPIGGCTGVGVVSGVATCVIPTGTYTSAVSHTITAQYLGGTGYAASAVSTSITQPVTAASTKTVVVSTTGPSVVGQPVTYTATVSAKMSTCGATPYSNVWFSPTSRGVDGTGSSTVPSTHPMEFSRRPSRGRPTRRRWKPIASAAGR